MTPRLACSRALRHEKGPGGRGRRSRNSTAGTLRLETGRGDSSIMQKPTPIISLESMTTWDGNASTRCVVLLESQPASSLFHSAFYFASLGRCTHRSNHSAHITIDFSLFHHPHSRLRNLVGEGRCDFPTSRSIATQHHFVSLLFFVFARARANLIDWWDWTGDYLGIAGVWTSWRVERAGLLCSALPADGDIYWGFFCACFSAAPLVFLHATDMKSY